MPPRPRITYQKAASAAMPPPPPQSAARLPSLAPHEVGRGCNMNRHAEDSWRSHVHRTCTAQRVQPFKLQTANVGGRGGLPSPFSGGSKGGILFGKRIPPLSGSGAQRRTIHAAQRAAPSHPPRRRKIKRGFPLRKESIPLCLAVALSAALTHAAQRAAPPHPPAKGGIKRGNLFEKRIPPLSGSSAKSCTNSCSADGAATTHPPQGRLKRDTLFRKKVSPFIFPFPRSAEISVPAPVQDYFLKLSFSVTDRLNTRCSGVQSLLSRQK